MKYVKIGAAAFLGIWAADNFLIDYGNGKGLVKAAPGIGLDDAMKAGAVVVAYLAIDAVI